VVRILLIGVGDKRAIVIAVGYAIAVCIGIAQVAQPSPSVSF